MIIINIILLFLITITGSVTYGNDLTIGSFVVEKDTGSVTTGGSIWTTSSLYVGAGMGGATTYISGDHVTTSGTFTGNGSGLTNISSSSHTHGGGLFTKPYSNVWEIESSEAQTKIRIRSASNYSTLVSYDKGFILAAKTATTMVVKQTNGENYASYDGDNGWDFYSDRRLKTEIEIETNILERIMEIDVVSFKFKDGLQFRKQLGFLAQDIEPHFPLLITEQEDEKYDFKVKSLGYSTFGVLAFGGIRELKIEKDREIDALKSENETLKSTLDSLTQRIEALENQ